MRYTVLRATPEKKRSNRIRLSYGHLVKVGKWTQPEQIFQRPLSMLLFSLTSAEVVVTSPTASPRSKNDTLPMKGDALVQGARGRPQASRSGDKDKSNISISKETLCKSSNEGYFNN